MRVVVAVTRSEGLVYAVGIGAAGHSQPLDETALRSMTDVTGGFSVVVRRDADIARAVERVIDDLRFQYVIGFSPGEPPDDKYHPVSVKVNCACRARTRAGFIHAPRASVAARTTVG